MTIRPDYLLIALAVILLITNCLGALFTIRRNLAAKDELHSGTPASSNVEVAWAGSMKAFIDVIGFSTSKGDRRKH